MPRSIFDRDIFLKMEQLDNHFIASRALSLRAREVNSIQKSEEEEEAASAPALALEDYLEGRIFFTRGEDEDLQEE
ncbi:MAG: hypothetical protein HOC74_15145 [Gemmatimonadetes bacterium]|jgi:hypothetical protein|nr:hypothetical protein [Gemmatimonadota bacterium]